jgi:hypothetical protein
MQQAINVVPLSNTGILRISITNKTEKFYTAGVVIPKENGAGCPIFF